MSARGNFRKVETMIFEFAPQMTATQARMYDLQKRYQWKHYSAFVTTFATNDNYARLINELVNDELETLGCYQSLLHKLFELDEAPTEVPVNQFIMDVYTYHYHSVIEIDVIPFNVDNVAKLDSVDFVLHTEGRR